MKNKKLLWVLVPVLLILIIGSMGFFVLNETQQAIITRFGKPIRTILQPGLHFKVPVVDVMHVFEKRFLEWRGESNQVTTRDKRYIWVDTYARWRIVDPLLFYQRLKDERGALSRIDDIIDGETRTAFAKHDLIEHVRTSNREPLRDPVLDLDVDSLGIIQYGRSLISFEIRQKASARAEDLGIEILDFKIKRINYVREVQNTVFERMITERKRIADQYRSEGQGEASRISGERDRELKRIQSEAERTAQEIRGKSDAQAAAIYSNAYNRNTTSREFYTFMKTMDSYEQAFDSTTSIVLSTDSDFYKFLKLANPK
ncbi:MAG: protease modulator HflC [FCB group bacterium]|nr:protease modulator HflC [FCB group bacterium]